jgi:hypothetical protein
MNIACAIHYTFYCAVNLQEKCERYKPGPDGCQYCTKTHECGDMDAIAEACAQLEARIKGGKV